MLIPRYWAEARARQRAAGKQVTVRRFGWSEVGQDEAQSAAQARADEALARILAGDRLERSEPKVPYNGAEGVPIREEILEQRGEVVITRNSYGAPCLNSPDALFADIDFNGRPGTALVEVVIGLLTLGGLWLGKSLGGWGVGVVLAVVAAVASYAVASAVMALRQRLGGGAEVMARKRILGFLAAHPDWQLRLYRTPAGLRTLAMHRRFDARQPEVAAFFTAVGADPMYVRMCQRQQCFRARLGPKPWRMGLPTRMKPRPGVWPVDPSRLPERARWIEDYERRAEAYSACRFLEVLGDGRTDPGLDAVRELHDDRCRATRDLPLA